MAYFYAADYSVLIMSLMISVVTGVYFAVKDRKRKTTDLYFYGDRRMSPVPVGLSMGVSFISAVSLMGLPVETYFYGTLWLWALPTIPITVAITCAYVVPLFYKLRLKCVYEYVELRFNKSTRKICSVMIFVYMLFYMAIVTYYPALALNTLTPISVEWSIAITCIVCTFYSVIGGFKTVVWTDTFQTLVMCAGSVAILIQTTTLAGGVSAVLGATLRGNRTVIWSFDTNPTTRCTVWSIFSMNFILFLMLLVSHQSEVQRYLSCKSLRDSKISLAVSTIPHLITIFVSIAIGVSIYAFFEGCDPLSTGEITKEDQLVPLLVGKITTGVHGLNGLFVSAVFSSTMSTFSSGINSMTVMIIEDFVLEFRKNLSEDKKMVISNVSGVCIGAVVLVISYSITYMQGTIVQITVTILSAFNPPVFGVFMLGMFVPWANTRGTLIGALFGFVTVGWISVGALFQTPGKSQKLPLLTDQCNESFYIKNFSTTNISYRDYNTVYDVSPFYLRPLSFLITFLVGIVASFACSPNNPKDSNPDYFAPLVTHKMFPQNVRQFFRFGVPEEVYAKEEMNQLKDDSRL